jgi:Carboxypeptidase regulatory-like domain
MFQRVAVLLCLAVCGAVQVGAQAPVGSISGVVHDQTGGVMAGAAITVTHNDTGVERHAVSAADGAFAVAALPAGAYTIRGAAAGFRTLVTSATVQVGQVTSVDLAMEVGATNEVVSVEAEAAQIDYDSHTISGVITRERIENLPLNGRDFLQLAMLEPGVTVSANNVGQYNRKFDVSILGANSGNGSVRITVDGATIADSVTGGTQQNFSQEVVQEFQLSSTNMDLSTSIGAGGAVNIVTRSGGNDFHGSGFFFFRDHNMSAYPYLQRDPNEPASPFFARRQIGYQFGGPIKKDRLFFFSNLEHTNQTGVFSAFPGGPTARISINSPPMPPARSMKTRSRRGWTGILRPSITPSCAIPMMEMTAMRLLATATCPRIGMSTRIGRTPGCSRSSACWDPPWPMNFATP